MTFDTIHSADPARHNHIDRRHGGVLEFSDDNAWNEGPAALSFGDSSTRIDLDISGAALLVNGNKVNAPANTVTLADGDDSLWRTDHIYATADGGFAVHEGEAGDNQFVTHEIDNGTVAHSIQQNETAGGPRPKGTPFDGVDGELLFSVLVPPGATSADDLSEQHVWDRRRVALDLLDTGISRNSAIVERDFTLEAGEWELWPIVPWSGQTLRLWGYALTTNRFGAVNTDNFHVYLVDYLDAGLFPSDFEDMDWSEIAVWESADPRQRSTDGTPIFERRLTGETDAHAFVLENVGDTDYVEAHRRLGLHARYTLENSDDL